MQLKALGLGQQRRQGELARVQQQLGSILHHKKWMVGEQETHLAPYKMDDGWTDNTFSSMSSSSKSIHLVGR
jgi:hypothetical protein